MRIARKLQVFVSSTYTDLVGERQAAVEAILRAGHIPAGMELFNPGDKSQWETITRWIDESDVYMLIIGGRYGSVDKDTGKSYTQMEYEYALDKGKPFFAVIVDEKILEDRVKQHGLSVIEQDHPAELKAFREDVKTKMVGFWKDAHDVRYEVRNALDEIAANYPNLTGWVRADTVVNSVSAKEIAELEQKTAALEAKLAERDNEISQGDDVIDVTFLYEVVDDRRVKDYDGHYVVSVRWHQIISLLAIDLLAGADEGVIHPLLNNYFVKEAQHAAPRPAIGNRNTNFALSDRSFNKIKLQLMALRIVEVNKPENPGVTFPSWDLTEFGKSVIFTVGAIRRKPEPAE